jgi:sn-glycerol 3-phosphate transport system substrate-binding protein
MKGGGKCLADLRCRHSSADLGKSNLLAAIGGCRVLYQYRKVALQVVLTTLVMISLCLPVAAADVNIEWWIGGLEAQKQAANSLAETWMEDNPDYTFDIMDVGGWYDVHTKVMTSIAAGTLPHLVRGKDFWLVDWVQGDFLLELDEYIERDKDELGWGPMFMELLEKCRYDGKIKALPWHQYFHSLYWNKTLFAEAGLSSPPDTWEEMIEYGKKLTRPEKDIYGVSSKLKVRQRGCGRFLGLFMRPNLCYACKP